MTRSTRQRTVGGAVAVVLLGVVAVVLTYAVVRHDALAELDGPWRDWVITHRAGALTEVMVYASRFGSTPSLVMILLVVAWLLVRRGRRGDALLVVVGCGTAFLLGPALKALVERPRPDLVDHVVAVDSWSYPSGHSLNSMVAIGMLTVLAIRAGTGALRAVLLGALGAALVATVGFSRVYLGVHWPSDVLAGWLIGVCWLTICFTVARFLPGNRDPSGTVQPSS